MEPDLITKKTIEKIIKKNYFVKESSFNKFIKNINNKYINNLNWPVIIIVFFIFIILIFLYNNHQTNKKKKAEHMKMEEEMKIINSKSEDFENDDFKSKPNYESEYYKMLPKITNNPEIHEYKY